MFLLIMNLYHIYLNCVLGCLKITKDKATNVSLIRKRGSLFNSNTNLKTDTIVMFQLKRKLYQVGDMKVNATVALIIRTRAWVASHSNSNMGLSNFASSKPTCKPD